MATQPVDPKNPATKPHGTTKDQINEMESEGQALTPGQPAPVESPSADQMQGAAGPTPASDPDEAAPRGGDQDIDAAGTEADTGQSATGDPTGQAKDRKVEVPGDTGSADIVGRTGEEMPVQSHDGMEAESRQTTSRRGSLHH